MHPNEICRRCGACCAFYRVSFYWPEKARLRLPTGSVEPVNEYLACMAGTKDSPRRCIALEGEVGHEVTCSVYAERPSPCREVQPGDEQCNRARAAHGLAPIEGGA